MSRINNDTQSRESSLELLRLQGGKSQKGERDFCCGVQCPIQPCKVSISTNTCSESVEYDVDLDIEAAVRPVSPLTTVLSTERNFYVLETGAMSRSTINEFKIKDVLNSFVQNTEIHSLLEHSIMNTTNQSIHMFFSSVIEVMFFGIGQIPYD